MGAKFFIGCVWGLRGVSAIFFMERNKDLASVDDVPFELRALARRVPADVMAAMTPFEARMRVEYVNDLIGRAECEPERTASRTRRLAERVLKSLSDDAFSVEQARLRSDFTAASGLGNSGAAYLAAEAIRRFEARNPRIPPERLMAATAAQQINSRKPAAKRARKLQLFRRRK